MTTRAWTITHVLLAVLFLGGCGDSDGSSGGSDGNATPRLSFQVSFRGTNLADAAVTLLDRDGQEISGAELRTNDVGYIVSTEIEGIPDDGFVARACVPKPGTADVQCLHAAWNRRPQAVALVTINDETTLDFDAEFATCEWVHHDSGLTPRTCPTGPDDPLLSAMNFPNIDPLLQVEDPILIGQLKNISIYEKNLLVPFDNNIVNKREPVSTWKKDAQRGLAPSLIPQIMLTSVVSNLTGMGINFLMGKLFPTVDYSALAFQQLTLLTDMVARFQDEVRGEFDTLAHQLAQEYVDLEIPKLQSSMEFIFELTTSLNGHLAQASTSSTDPAVRAEAQANLLRDLREDFLPNNILPNYGDLRIARNDLSNIVPKVFEYFSYADKPWTKDRARLGLYSAQYSTNLYKLYLAITAALAQAEDFENRLYVYSMTMVDVKTGDPCKCADNEQQPCLGNNTVCRNTDDGSQCEAHCARVSKVFPQVPNLNSKYPAAPNPVPAFYEPIYTKIRTSFVGALGKGVPGFLVMEDPEGRRSMLAPYLSKPDSVDRFPAHQAALDTGDFASVVWDVDTTATDPTGTVLAANIAAMGRFDDWQIGRFSPDHYIVNHFMQVGSTAQKHLRGIDVLGDNGVRLGNPVRSESGVLSATDADFGPMVSMFGFAIDDAWRSFYPAHVRCYSPLEVHWSSGFFGQNCNSRREEVVANWFRDCIVAASSDHCSTYEWASCSGFPQPDDDRTYMNRADYDAALPFCRMNHDYNVSSFHPAAGGVGATHPSTIGRTWREFPALRTADDITVSDSTIATNITPVMWCPATLGGEAFIQVSLENWPGSSESVAICTYADGSEAVFDPGLNGFVDIDGAGGSSLAVVSPYNAQNWRGTVCAADDAAACPFLLLNPSRYVSVAGD